ncbi:MAG TPA: hypothetical protein VM098_04425 [Phycisphaerae bacterium]|nr:hypothetical protein [Phycisphaerae bacterium]
MSGTVKRLLAFAAVAVAPAMLAGLLLAMAEAGVELTEDKPPVAAPRSGSVSGTLTPAGKVARLSAVSRVTGKSYLPAAFDKKTGRFTFDKLPGDATYDICIDTSDGRRIEGIDLDFVDARLLRLAGLRRKQLGVPEQRGGEFSQADAEELLKFVRDMEDFMEIRRVLYVQGHGRRATMLVELMRTREFYSSKGEVIWRVELWYFENQFGGWQRLSDQQRVLRRERISPDEWRKIDVTYYPQLGAYVAPDGACKAVEFQVPQRSDAACGRPANTEPRLATAPHILGLAVDEPAATRPAPDGGRTESSESPPARAD